MALREWRENKKVQREAVREMAPIGRITRKPAEDELANDVLNPVEEMWKVFHEQRPRFKQLFFERLLSNTHPDEKERIKALGLTPQQLAKVLSHNAAANEDYLQSVLGRGANSDEDNPGIHQATLAVAEPLFVATPRKFFKSVMRGQKLYSIKRLLTFKGGVDPKRALVHGLLNSIEQAGTGENLQDAITTAGFGPAAPSAPNVATPAPRPGRTGQRPAAQTTPSGRTGQEPNAQQGGFDEVREHVDRLVAERRLQIGNLALRGIATHGPSAEYSEQNGYDSKKGAVARLMKDAADFAHRMHLFVLDMPGETGKLSNAALNAPSPKHFVERLQKIASESEKQEGGGVTPDQLDEHLLDLEKAKLFDGDKEVTNYHPGNLARLKIGRDPGTAMRLTNEQRQTLAYLLLAKLAKKGAASVPGITDEGPLAERELIAFTRNAPQLNMSDISGSIEHDVIPLPTHQDLLGAVNAVVTQARRRRIEGQS